MGAGEPVGRQMALGKAAYGITELKLLLGEEVVIEGGHSGLRWMGGRVLVRCLTT